MSYQFTIYKISCRNAAITDCYVGGTRAFRSRVYNHQRAATSPEKLGNLAQFPVYKCIRANGGWANWRVEVLEELAGTLADSHRAEQRYIDELGASLNRNHTPYDDQSEKATLERKVQNMNAVRDADRAAYNKRNLAHSIKYWEANKPKILAKNKRAYAFKAEAKRLRAMLY